MTVSMYDMASFTCAHAGHAPHEPDTRRSWRTPVVATRTRITHCWTVVVSSDSDSDCNTDCSGSSLLLFQGRSAWSSAIKECFRNESEMRCDAMPKRPKAAWMILESQDSAVGAQSRVLLGLDGDAEVER